MHASAQPTWPECPDCGKRRIATCPVCQTASTEFDLADPDFPVGHAGQPDAGPSGGCGTGACPPAAQEAEAPAAPQAPAAEGPGPESLPGDDESPPQLVLICTTCDEPFHPTFPRRCEWCGHGFPDGFPVDVEEHEGEPPERFNPRMLVVLVGLLLFAAAGVVYLMLVLPGD